MISIYNFELHTSTVNDYSVVIVKLNIFVKK